MAIFTVTDLTWVVRSFCNRVVKWTKYLILAILIFAVPLTTAQITSSEESGAAMSEREKRGLRGPVKSCIQESGHAGMADAEGKTYPEVHSQYTTEYDTVGRILAARSRNSDGSQWVTRYAYDPSGRLLKTRSGIEGQTGTGANYSYDQHGRLQNISDDGRTDSWVTLRYDERGRKTKIEISGPADYRPNTAVAGSPFEVADRAPNLPGGGSATTIYDDHDRATEVQVRDARGELVNRAVRTYDAQGHILEEKQILDNPETMFPAETRAQMLEQSGLSPDQLQQELRTQLTKLMAGQSGPYSVSYGYDTHGRVNRTSRRIFSEVQEIETAYNEHGDAASEITRSKRLAGQTDPTAVAAGSPSYSEVRYSYKYDDRGNWIEQSISYRSGPEAAFQSSTVIKRTLTYY
jgi:YD repeat-containing protein